MRDRLKELEAERVKVVNYHDDEEKRLLQMLKQLELDEEERLRQHKLWLERHRLMEHFADGEVDINQYSDAAIDKKCDDLF